ERLLELDHRLPRLAVDRRREPLEGPEERFHVLRPEREQLLLPLPPPPDARGRHPAAGPLRDVLHPVPDARLARGIGGPDLRRLAHRGSVRDAPAMCKRARRRGEGRFAARTTSCGSPGRWSSREPTHCPPWTRRVIAGACRRARSSDAGGRRRAAPLPPSP